MEIVIFVKNCLIMVSCLNCFYYRTFLCKSFFSKESACLYWTKK